jgi:hypothetical protein
VELHTENIWRYDNSNTLNLVNAWFSIRRTEREAACQNPFASRDSFHLKLFCNCVLSLFHKISDIILILMNPQKSHWTHLCLWCLKAVGVLLGMPCTRAYVYILRPSTGNWVQSQSILINSKRRKVDSCTTEKCSVELKFSMLPAFCCQSRVCCVRWILPLEN